MTETRRAGDSHKIIIQISPSKWDCKISIPDFCSTFYLKRIVVGSLFSVLCVCFINRSLLCCFFKDVFAMMIACLRRSSGGPDQTSSRIVHDGASRVFGRSDYSQIIIISTIIVIIYETINVSHNCIVLGVGGGEAAIFIIIVELDKKKMMIKWYYNSFNQKAELDILFFRLPRSAAAISNRHIRLYT